VKLGVVFDYKYTSIFIVVLKAMSHKSVRLLCSTSLSCWNPVVLEMFDEDGSVSYVYVWPVITFCWLLQHEKE
jgi:hypothetical protein